DPAILRHVTILKLAEEEARVVAGGIEPEALAALGVPEILLTLGDEGSLVLANGRVHRVPSQRVHARDPTGAGDGFAAVPPPARDLARRGPDLDGGRRRAPAGLRRRRPPREPRPDPVRRAEPALRVRERRRLLALARARVRRHRRRRLALKPLLDFGRRTQPHDARLAEERLAAVPEVGAHGRPDQEADRVAPARLDVAAPEHGAAADAATRAPQQPPHDDPQRQIEPDDRVGALDDEALQLVAVRRV